MTGIWKILSKLLQKKRVRAAKPDSDEILDSDILEESPVFINGDDTNAISEFLGDLTEGTIDEEVGPSFESRQKNKFSSDSGADSEEDEDSEEDDDEDEDEDSVEGIFEEDEGDESFTKGDVDDEMEDSVEKAKTSLEKVGEVMDDLDNALKEISKYI